LIEMVTGERWHLVVKKRLDVNAILATEFEYVATTLKLDITTNLG
jgi:hypothetical protein